MKMFRLTMVALLGLAGIQGAVAGDDRSAAKQRIVKFADLNVAAPEGATMLYMRLRAAARQVCSDLDGRQLRQRQQYQACMADSVANAVAAVNEPALTDVYLAQSGRTRPAARIARNP